MNTLFESETRTATLEEHVPYWHETYDVVVIGAGFAGLTAAIEAHNAGASVVVIEKMKAPGGNSIISDGGIAAAGTSMQEKAGIADSAELMYSDMLKAGMGLNHPALVREVATHSTEAFLWSRDYLGVPYMDRIDQFGGHTVPRCYTAENVSGSTIIRCQVAKLRELDVEMRTQTMLKGLIRDASGTVCGVAVRDGYNHKSPHSGTDRFIKATRGVILATGGFGADVSFRTAQDPRLSEEIDTTNTPFATAEALIEALRIQAMPVHLSHIQLGPWASPDEKGFGDGPRFADYIVFQYGLIVSPTTSARIVNELADRKTVADAILEVGRPCIGIADSKAVEQSGWSIDRGIEKGVVKVFSSLSELGSHYGLDNAALASTVERFNGFVEAKADAEFGKPIISEAGPLTNPPFFAMRLWPKVHHTMGGVQINASAQVIDLKGYPTGGLYAAGEATGGVHGACRLGSCAITDCLVFGRIAGRSAATEKP
ncbi:MAG: flavocytochrome c [Dehalococcoidia bacterium]|nr:flavocytochrome c [Dehalococcoidia bacterium]